jgi:hypothetical protein
VFEDSSYSLGRGILRSWTSALRSSTKFALDSSSIHRFHVACVQATDGGGPEVSEACGGEDLKRRTQQAVT